MSKLIENLSLEEVSVVERALKDKIKEIERELTTYSRFVKPSDYDETCPIAAFERENKQKYERKLKCLNEKLKKLTDVMEQKVERLIREL